MKNGRCGEVYNIGSGQYRKISDILDLLLSFTTADIKVFEDPSKMRPSDTPLLYGDCSKIRNDVGYEPEYRLEETLKEIMDYWRGRVVSNNNL